MSELVVLVLCYLVGSISFARLVLRLFAPQESATAIAVTVPGTGQTYTPSYVSAQRVSMRLGASGGMLVSLLDVLKVAVPVLVCSLLWPRQLHYAYLASLAGMAGHIWPVYHRFRGGGGYSAVLGSLLVLDWPAALLLPLTGTVLGIAVFRSLLVTTLSWLWLLVAWAAWRWLWPEGLLYALGVNVLFVLAMVPEIKAWSAFNRRGQALEFGLAQMEASPMGRGIFKMARRLGVTLR